MKTHFLNMNRVWLRAFDSKTMSKEYVYANMRRMSPFLRFRRLGTRSSDLPYTLTSWSRLKLREEKPQSVWVFLCSHTLWGFKNLPFGSLPTFGVSDLSLRRVWFPLVYVHWSVVAGYFQNGTRLARASSQPCPEFVQECFFNFETSWRTAHLVDPFGVLLLP